MVRMRSGFSLMSLLYVLARQVLYLVLFLVRRCGAQNTDGKSGFWFIFKNAIICLNKLSEEA